MPVLFVFAIIFAVLGVMVVIASLLFVSDFYTRKGILAGLAVSVIGGGIFALMACITSVPAQSVGVQVSFGKPMHNFGPGLHFKRPWSTVIDMDGRTQTERHTAPQAGPADDPKADKGRVEIRLGNQATGFVQSSLRWKIRPEAAGNLYADYREFDLIGPNLVDVELAAAMNVAFADYDPIGNLKAQAGDKTAVVVTNDQLGQRVADHLNTRIGSTASLDERNRIVIESVVISKIDFDDATQQRINQLQQEIGNTRIAEQAKLTAKAQAAANRELADSVSHDPNVIVAQCMSQQREAVEKGLPIPPGGFGCWPGSQTAVIANTGK